jgi:arylsulfatase A-like enzyme
MSRYLKPLLIAALAIGHSAFAAQPNVVVILTDNQGDWTLGCYGNQEIRTPNVDRLAAQGTLFTRAFACNGVCSPNRATFLTGLIPSQHGVHCFLDPKFNDGPNAKYQLGEFTTLPKVMKTAGYQTALIGKWHLGDNAKPHDGFDYWVSVPAGSTKEMHGNVLADNGRIYTEPRHATEVFTEHAVRFIEQNKARPFVLYLAYGGPNVLGPMLEKPAQNHWAEYYADKPLECFPRDTMHPWQHRNGEFHDSPVARRRVAAEVSTVDDGVGAVMDALQRLGLDGNTVIAYASDNGWSGGHHGLIGMSDHTRPLGAFDPQFKIPFIFRHPGKIAAGARNDLLVSNYDFLPTLLGHLGLTHALQYATPKSPGRDLSPALRGVAMPLHEPIFMEMEIMRAIRTDQWKFVRRHPSGPHELYDLADDPGETFNLYGQPEHAAHQQQLDTQLTAFFKQYADPKYDLFNGGGSKVTPLLQRNDPGTKAKAAAKKAKKLTPP